MGRVNDTEAYLSDFQREVEKLQREGRMPTLEQMLAAVQDTREQYREKEQVRGTLSKIGQALVQLGEAVA